MIKRWLSNFLKKNQSKFKDIGIKLIIVAIVVFIATIILSFNNNSDNENTTAGEVYNPTETIIKGSNVTENQYKEDENIVKKFVEYCNNSEIQKAYDLLSNECKENRYPSLDTFKNTYYAVIFKEKKDYNLQSWISTSQYTVYKIRYTTDILSTGIYQEDNVYEDYITLIKNSDKAELSIGNYITSQNINKTTNTKEIEATVIKKDIYLEYEEYEILVRNKTDKTILLDDLTNIQNIKLIGDSGGAYSAYTNKIFKTNLLIQSKTSKKIIISFKKEAGANNNSESIRFTQAITDYDQYNNDENYQDRLKIEINL